MAQPAPKKTTQNSALPKITADSVRQCNLPDIWDENGDPHPAWFVEATEEEVTEAAAFMVTAVEPEASEQRAQMVARLLKTRDYSRAELLLAMRELPFDAEAAHNFGQGFNPADVERIIEENRTIRAKTQVPLSSKERDELITKYPDKIDPNGFHICGYNCYDEPEWIYAPDADAEPRDPNPDLGKSLPGRERAREGESTNDPIDVEELVDEYT